MSNPRVCVRMDGTFYDALCGFADEQECTPSEMLLRAAKVYMSQHKRWRLKTRARGLRICVNGSSEQGREEP